MGQLGFFDADKRLEALSAKGDPLEAIDRLVPWESFRAEVEAVVLTSDELKKSSAARKPFDALLMFRMLVLQALNNLSDEQVLGPGAAQAELTAVCANDRQSVRGTNAALHDAGAGDVFGAMGILRDRGRTRPVHSATPGPPDQRAPWYRANGTGGRIRVGQLELAAWFS